MKVVVSGRGCHHRLVTVTLDDCDRAPVLVRRDLPEPPPCRHTKRCCTDGVENTVQYRAHRLAGFFFHGLVALCRHGLFSRTIPAKSAPGGADICRGGPILPGSRSCSSGRRALRGKRSGGSFFRSWSVNSGTSVRLSRVFPRDPHSDQEISLSSTYNPQIYRVPGSYHAVQRLNRDNGKDINTDLIFLHPQKNYPWIWRLALYPA
jgi:hypothetical protein